MKPPLFQEDIFVTKPFLPPFEAFIPRLKEIWDSRVLTNGGPFHRRFEMALGAYLGVEHLSLFVNGTIALLTALQALRITGEVLTTPFSFVATSHALLWNGAKPIFVDIDENTLNMDVSKIEAAITSRTTAILAVHCYGHPCDIQAIREIAERYNLKVIYDAAHAFGVKDDKGSILRHGDLSVLSFHATKVFNTFEGGAIICPDEKTKRHIDDLKNFGYAGEVTVVAHGINGKMNEFCAALGLLQLEYIDQALARRAAIDARYRERLRTVKGIRCLANAAGKDNNCGGNHAYFPILVGKDYSVTRDDLYCRLKEIGIYPRRYFYPLISEFPMYRGLDSAKTDNLPVATQLSRQVLCLPIYPDLEISVVDAVCDYIAGQLL
jgi:dTDP-4-amino-4,6-dideoxygalactose transaminase